ncbi:MAG: AI-2E family transporter [Deltaproteobacteria bacterium]|nr:AI-2E family transporter [Deltaproteobacteria bacterium]
MEFIKKNQDTLILACLWLSMLVGLIILRGVLLPFILAALLAYVLHPLVSKIAGRQIRGFEIPRFAAVLIIYAAIGVFIYLFSAFFLPELYRELLKLGKTATDVLNSLHDADLQDYAGRIESFLRHYQLPFQEVDMLQFLRNMLAEISEFVRAQSANIVMELQALFKGVLRFLFGLMLVLMIAGFVLVDTDRIRHFLFRLVTPKSRASFEVLLSRIDRGLSGVVRGQLTICVVNAILTFIGLILLKVKFAFILATLAGIFSLIPIFGSIISTIPITLVALMSSFWTSLLALLWIVGIHALEANFLNPKILGHSAQIHPVLVVLALVAGEHHYGIFGALLAVPIASIVLTMFQSFLAKASNDAKP